MSEFSVTNQTSGREFSVGSEETILDSILRQGFAVPYSCRNGTCASCKARLISGRVRHDQYEQAALSNRELTAGKILLCRAHPIDNLVIDVEEIPLLSAIQIQKLPCRVLERNLLAHDVMQIKLALPPNTQFDYIAGQYIDVMMRGNRRRGFSIANSPGNSILELHVRHVPNGRFTTHVFKSMKVREILRFEGPLGTFFLRSQSDLPIIFIAGGTGFAPINSIIEQILRDQWTRPIYLFWGVRSLRDLYLHRRALKWTETFHSQFQYTPVLSEPRIEDNWQGETGWVHDCVLKHFKSFENYEVYASGPPPMIDAIRTTFPSHGLALENLFYDSFEFSTDTLYPE